MEDKKVTYDFLDFEESSDEDYSPEWGEIIDKVLSSPYKEEIRLSRIIWPYDEGDSPYILVEGKLIFNQKYVAPNNFYTRALGLERVGREDCEWEEKKEGFIRRMKLRLLQKRTDFITRKKIEKRNALALERALKVREELDRRILRLKKLA